MAEDTQNAPAPNEVKPTAAVPNEAEQSADVAPNEAAPAAEAVPAQAAEGQPAEAAPAQAEEGAQEAKKVRCSKCGRTFVGAFCPYCGAKVKELEKCPVCGTPRESGMKFCAKCGYSFAGNSGGAQLKGMFSSFATSAKRFFRRNGKKVIAASVIVAILLVIIIPIAVVFTSPTAAANVDRINIGDSKERVLDILGEPYDYDPKDVVFTYYSSNYEKILKKLDSISNMDDIEDFEDLGNALEDEMELEQKLEEMEYKETRVTFDNKGLVTSLLYNAKAKDDGENTKELKSSEVMVSEIVGYETVAVPYTLKYEDGSIYKGTQSVMIESFGGEGKFYALNPFGESVEFTISVVRNSNVKTDYSNGVEYIVYPNGEATISGTGIITKELVDRIADDIVTLVVEEGITGIGDEAFANCGSITSVSIPSTITSVGKNAFGSKSFTIKNGVKYLGNEENPYHVALGLSNANSIQFNINENTKVIADYAFYQSEKLTAAYMPAGSVEYIGTYAFADCPLLRGVTMESDVKEIGDYAFSKCSSLQSISIPESVTSIGSYILSGDAIICKPLPSRQRYPLTICLDQAAYSS